MQEEKKDDSETWQTRNFTMAASLMMGRKKVMYQMKLFMKSFF